LEKSDFRENAVFSEQVTVQDVYTEAIFSKAQENEATASSSSVVQKSTDVSFNIKFCLESLV